MTTTTQLLNASAALLNRLGNVKNQREYAVLNRERMKLREQVEGALETGGFAEQAREELRGALFMLSTAWLRVSRDVAREVNRR